MEPHADVFNITQLIKGLQCHSDVKCWDKAFIVAEKHMALKPFFDKVFKILL
jgi:hypothetical protein